MTLEIALEGVDFATATLSEVDPARPELFLAPADLVAYWRLRTEDRRRARLAGRLAARRALRQALGSRTSFVLHTEASGRPYDPQRRRSVSITHCGDQAFAVAGHQNIGIDVERIEVRDRSFEALFLSPSEQLSLPCDPALRSRLVTRTWCALEAYGKALGCGLSRPFRALRPPPGLVRSGSWSTASHELAWAVASSRGS